MTVSIFLTLSSTFSFPLLSPFTCPYWFSPRENCHCIAFFLPYLGLVFPLSSKSDAPQLLCSSKLACFSNPILTPISVSCMITPTLINQFLSQWQYNLADLLEGDSDFTASSLGSHCPFTSLWANGAHQLLEFLSWKSSSILSQPVFYPIWLAEIQMLSSNSALRSPNVAGLKGILHWMCSNYSLKESYWLLRVWLSPSLEHPLLLIKVLEMAILLSDLYSPVFAQMPDLNQANTDVWGTSRSCQD